MSVFDYLFWSIIMWVLYIYIYTYTHTHTILKNCQKMTVCVAFLVKIDGKAMRSLSLLFKKWRTATLFDYFFLTKATDSITLFSFSFFKFPKVNAIRHFSRYFTFENLRKATDKTRLSVTFFGNFLTTTVSTAHREIHFNSYSSAPYQTITSHNI